MQTRPRTRAHRAVARRTQGLTAMRALLLVTTGLAGLALLRRRRPDCALARPSPAPIAPDPVDVAEVTRTFLLHFVMPLWITAGFADWLCHRASDIATSAGPKESLIHLLMLVEAAVPVLAGLFLEITSPVLAMMIAGFLLHDATALWDVAYASHTREVKPIEQHVHTYLGVVPLMAVAFVTVLHWPQFLGLLHLGGQRPDWSLRLKRQHLPWSYVVPFLGALTALDVAPYLEELARGLAATRKRRHLAGLARTTRGSPERQAIRRSLNTSLAQR